MSLTLYYYSLSLQMKTAIRCSLERLDGQGRCCWQVASIYDIKYPSMSGGLNLREAAVTSKNLRKG